MKKLLIFCSIVFLLCVSSVQAKSYSYDYINIGLELSADGSVLVKQERAYNFEGSFSFAYLDLKKAGAEDIEFISIKDVDTGTDVPYSLEESQDHVKATWNYQANNEIKRFLITYEITGAVKRYQDVAELYWKVIEEEHEFIKSFHAEVNLPEPSPNLFKVFIHTRAEPGILSFSEDLSKATVDLSDVPANSFVEFRVLASPSIFSSVPLIQANQYEAILDEERAIFQQDQLNSFFSSGALYLLLLPIPIVAVFIYYLAYGREPKVDYQLKYLPEPPSDIPPMALSVLYHGKYPQYSARGLLATIFDLARRGYMQIREVKKKRLLGLGERTEQIFELTKKGKNATAAKSLLNFENDVLRLLFARMKSADSISSEDIKKWCQKNSSTMQGTLRFLQNDAQSWFEREQFKIYEDSTPAHAKRFAGLAVLFTILLFSPFVLLSILPFNLWFAVSAALVYGIVYLAVKLTKRWTPEAALQRKKWRAFKSYIKDFSDMENAPVTLLYIWDRLLIYAVVLGVAKELLENVKNLSLAKHRPVAPCTWYYPIGAPGVPKGMMSPQAFDSFASNMSNMISALSSSSSVGGGFSGGAGGGGGGGGGGSGAG